MKRIVIAVMAGMAVFGCGLRGEAPEEKAGSAPKTEMASRPVQQQTIKPVSQPAAPQQPFVALAIELLQKGEIVAGVQALDEAIKQDPANLQAYILLGQTYMHINEFDRAIDTFSAALRIDPNQGEVYYMMALCNGFRGQREAAVVSAEKALLIFQNERDEDNFKRTLALLQGLSQE